MVFGYAIFGLVLHKWISGGRPGPFAILASLLVVVMMFGLSMYGIGSTSDTVDDRTAILWNDSTFGVNGAISVELPSLVMCGTWHFGLGAVMVIYMLHSIMLLMERR